MGQEERWLTQYNETMGLLAANHRNPSRQNPGKRGLYLNWLKQNRKLMNAGKMKEERRALFLKLLELGAWYKRANQFH